VIALGTLPAGTLAPVIDLTRDGDVYVLRMTAGENRFNRPWLEGFTRALDEVEAGDGPAALVTTGEGKFYSNGLDLEWLLGEGKDELVAFAGQVQGVFARLLTFPVPTVAAMNGHAFAAGGMLALAHDFRVQRQDRGFFCLPEVDIKIPFTPGMTALIRSRLSPQVAHEAMVWGRRFGGAEAAAAGIVDEAVAEDAVLSRAIELAAGLAGKDRQTVHAIKSGSYGDVVTALRS
jgi:enoyl-CoA hydratase/carnithine racemase